MDKEFTLVTGRTREQAIGMHKGKSSPEYRRATTYVEMNPEDMMRLHVAAGDTVCLRSSVGNAELTVAVGTLPPGLLFVPLGHAVNALVPGETQGTGMPSFKSLRVEVSVTDEPSPRP